MSPSRYAVLQLAREKGSDRLDGRALDRIADALERLADEAERAEVRRAAKGLLKLQADYTEETERRPLRLVRK